MTRYDTITARQTTGENTTFVLSSNFPNLAQLEGKGLNLEFEHNTLGESLRRLGLFGPGWRESLFGCPPSQIAAGRAGTTGHQQLSPYLHIPGRRKPKAFQFQKLSLWTLDSGSSSWCDFVIITGISFRVVAQVVN